MEPIHDPSFISRPFTYDEALMMGLSPDQLRNSKAFTNVSHGIHRPTEWEFDLSQAARALSAATPGAWISHGTAARLHGLILPPWLSESNELHLSKPRKLPEVRRKGITGHTLTTFPDEVEVVQEIRMSSRARTWLDLARTLPLKDLVSMGDQLIRIPRPKFEDREASYATLGSLRTMMQRHRNLQGIVRAREAIELMRVGADSGPETIMRLAMLDAGLPEPDLQIALWDRPDAPSADAGYRDRKIALQYDGAHHLDEVQKHKDKRRDRAFVAAGWTVLVFTQDDYADGFEKAILRVKQAMRNAWTDHSIAAGFASGR